MKHKMLWLCLVSVCLMAACSGIQSPTNEPATAIPPTPTALPPTAVVFKSNLPEFPLGPGGADRAGDEQAAGQYKTPSFFPIPFKFETTQVFRGLWEQLPKGDVFGIAQGSADFPPRQLLFWAVDPSASVEATISQLRATPYVDLTANQGVTVAGISGVEFSATGQVKASIALPAIAELVGHQGDAWHTNTADSQVRFIVLSVAERTLLIYIEAPKGEFQGFSKEVDHVLGTLTFDTKAPSASPAP